MSSEHQWEVDKFVMEYIIQEEAKNIGDYGYPSEYFLQKEFN